MKKIGGFLWLMLVILLQIFHFDSHYTFFPTFQMRRSRSEIMQILEVARWVVVNVAQFSVLKATLLSQVFKTIFLYDFIHFLGTSIRCRLGDICFTRLNFRSDYIYLRVKTGS